MARHDILVVDVPGEAHPLEVELAYTGMGNPDMPLLIFLHGLGAWREVWTTIVQHEAYAGIRNRLHCVALDFPGFGDSEALPGKHTIRRFAAVVAGAVKALDSGPAILVGHSLGGTVGYRTALDHPDAVRALATIVVQTRYYEEAGVERLLLEMWHPTVDPQDREITLARIMQDLPFLVYGVVRIAGPLGGISPRRLLVPGVARGITATAVAAINGLSKHDRRAIDEIKRELVLRNDLRDDLHKIIKPLLVLDGQPRSRPVNTRLEIAARAVNAPLKQVVCVKGSGHFAPIDAVKQCADALEAFIDELEAFEAAQKK